MKTKQFLAALLSSAMVLGTMAVPVFAANVAKIGDTEYATFEDAFAAAGVGKKITLLQDVNYDEEHEVYVQPNAVHLDLGGKTFTTNSEVSVAANNNGYKAAAICYSITSGDTVSISNGTINTAYGAGVYVDGNMTATLSSLTINAAKKGAQLTKEYSSAVRLTSGATAIINSGSYSAANGGYAIAVSNSGGTVTINGGTFDGALFFSVKTNSGVTKSITINGGTFKGEFVNTDNGTLTIKGGTFDHDPTAYVAEGYTTTENNGTWTVGTADFFALQNKLNNGGDVTLEKDYDLGYAGLTVPKDKIVTLDLNGYQISSDVNNGTKAASGNWTYTGTINNNGTLTIKDSRTNGKIIATKGTAVLNYGTITIESGEFYSAEFAAFDNFGTATVKDGTFKSDSNSKNAELKHVDGISSKYKYAFCNQAGTLTVDNATVTGVHGGMGFNAGNVTVNNANVRATNFYALYVAGERDNVQTIVKGGTFESGGSYTVYVGNDHDGGLKKPASCQIYDGTFNKGINAGSNTGNPTIYGGTFGADPQTYVAIGKSVSNTGNGYEVKAVNSSKLAEQINDAFSSVQTQEVYTAKSPVKDNGKYDQVSAAVLGNGNDDSKAFNVKTSDRTEFKVTLTDITDTVFTGSAQVVCGLIITDIPTDKFVTVTAVE